MKNANYCQSCAMPMFQEDVFGTNLDGSKNKEYCIHCYEKGNFTANISMEEMIEACVPHMVNANKGMSSEEAKKMMEEVFPKLKRWKK